MANKYALVVMGSDPEANSPHGRGRMIHALKTAKALEDGGHDVKILLEGAGVIWLKRFDLRDDKFAQHYGSAFDDVKHAFAGACDFCARVRFDVAEHADSLGIALVGGEKQHSTIAPLLAEGYQVITL